MEASPVMLIKRILLYILLGMLAQSNYQVYATLTKGKLIYEDDFRAGLLKAETSQDAKSCEQMSFSIAQGRKVSETTTSCSGCRYQPYSKQPLPHYEGRSGFDATYCPVEIQVKSYSQYKINLENYLVIECPVRYCQEKPVMQWCKIEVDTCVLLKEGKTEWKSNVFTLKFLSVQQNDSGTYHCQAKVDNFSSESHGIKVIVEEKSANIITASPENITSISKESQEFGNRKILHIIYASASVGLCCPFIIICMFCCLRRHHAKQKRSPLTPQTQESLVRTPEAAPFHTAGTTQASEESSSLYYCSMASPLQALHSNTIYDNDVPPWNTQRTAPNAPHNSPAIPSIPVLLESPDDLTYAALNHSASVERCQRRELTVENEFTEYASINVNK